MQKDLSRRHEAVDNTPVEVPTRLRLPVTRTEQMRNFIRAEMSRAAQDTGHETFEEADDFELDEEELPLSAYELRELDGQPAEAEAASAPPAKPGVAERSEARPADPAAGSTPPAPPAASGG